MTKRLWWMLTAAVLAITLTGCPSMFGTDEEEPPPTYRVEGTVTIGDTAIPVRDASVTVGELYAVTDREGSFTVSSVPSGSHNISVEKDGYVTYRQTHSVSRNLDLSVPLSYVPGEAPTARIIFLTANDAVVPSLPVTLTMNGDETDLVTDADGSVGLNVTDYLNAPFSVAVASTAFAELSQEFTLDQLESTIVEVEVTPLPVSQSAISDVATRLNAADDIVIEWSCDNPFVTDYRVMAKERHLVSGWTLEAEPLLGDWYEVYEGSDDTFTHQVEPTYNHEYAYAVIPLNLNGEAPSEWSENGVQALDVNAAWVLDRQIISANDSFVFAVPEIGRTDGIYLYGDWTLNHAVDPVSPFENLRNPPGWQIYFSESPDMTDERLLLESTSPEYESSGSGSSLVPLSGSSDILNLVEVPRSLTGKNLYLRVEKQYLSSFQFKAIVYNDTQDYDITDTSPDSFTITYDPNGATSGTAPSDRTASYNTTIDIPSQGTLARVDWSFFGWNSAADGSGTAYAVGAEHTIVGSITLYAQWEPYVVGDTGPAGGYIFYDDEADGVDDIPGVRFLEAAPEETEGTSTWGEWTSVGGTGTDIGDGYANTEAIVNALGDSVYAAKLCWDLSHNGYDDWFLPSKDELDLMYNNLHSAAVGSFSSSLYWTSSEYNFAGAWSQIFSSGVQDAGGNKDVPYRVRAVRAF